MTKTKSHTSKTPLIVRVAFCYVIFAVIFLLAMKSLSIMADANSPMGTFLPRNYISRKVYFGEINEKVVFDGFPKTFRVERLLINLPVKNGVYDNATGEWSLSNDAVYYISTTALPNNQRGSTFIYGHNRDQVIAKLSKLVVGDIVIVDTENGHSFYYAYTGDKSVPGNDMDILKEDSETPRLTVMTCDSFLSNTRRIMYFDLVEAI